MNTIINPKNIETQFYILALNSNIYIIDTFHNECLSKKGFYKHPNIRILPNAKCKKLKPKCKLKITFNYLKQYYE